MPKLFCRLEPLLTAPPVQPDVSAHTLAGQLSDLLPPMHFLLRPGHREPHAEPPSPEVRGQFRMMMILQHAGRLTMNDLATAMNVTPPTVTGIVKRMVAQGTVVRIPDPDDGRTVRVELTDDGRARMAAHRAQHITKLERLLDQVDAEDRQAIEVAIPAFWHMLSVAHAANSVADVLPAVDELPAAKED